MYILFKDGMATPCPNKATDGIDWAASAPGQTAIALSAADWQKACDWLLAGHHAGGIAPVAVVDENGANPGAEGYIPTFDAGVPDRWELLGNALVSNGTTVELHDPTGGVTTRLIGVLAG